MDIHMPIFNEARSEIIKLLARDSWSRFNRSIFYQNIEEPKPSTINDILDQLPNLQHLYIQAFSAFLTTEESRENLDFLIALQMNPENLIESQRIIHIYTRFIDPGTPHPINISFLRLKKLEKMIKNHYGAEKINSIIDFLTKEQMEKERKQQEEVDNFHSAILNAILAPLPLSPDDKSLLTEEPQRSLALYFTKNEKNGEITDPKHKAVYAQMKLYMVFKEMIEDHKRLKIISFLEGLARAERKKENILTDLAFTPPRGLLGQIKKNSSYIAQTYDAITDLFLQKNKNLIFSRKEKDATGKTIFKHRDLQELYIDWCTRLDPEDKKNLLCRVSSRSVTAGNSSPSSPSSPSSKWHRTFMNHNEATPTRSFSCSEFHTASDEELSPIITPLYKMRIEREKEREREINFTKDAAKQPHIAPKERLSK